MPKYCPVCQSEYKDDLILCPNDKKTLEKQPSRKPAHKNRAIFQTTDQIEQERIVEILEERGILAIISVQGISQIPSISETRFVMEVPEEKAKEAKEIIEQAIKDGVIGDLGIFI